MTSFFNDFLIEQKATPKECAVLLHTVSSTDSVIIRTNPDAALAYASFHEMPPNQRQRFRNETRFIFSFLATHDRYFVLNDIYEKKARIDPSISLENYRRYFPHNPLPQDRNHDGYLLCSMRQGNGLRGQLIIKKPDRYTQGYVFYADSDDCCKMLNAAILAKPEPEGGPMDLVIQMPLTLIASGFVHGHFKTPDFQKMGVYLLRHTPSNGTYVGSAYGVEGLVGRWREYVETVHGGNKGLIDLVLAGSTVKDFTVTALEITPNEATTLKAEKLWKSRLLPSLNKN